MRRRGSRRGGKSLQGGGEDKVRSEVRRTIISRRTNMRIEVLPSSP